MNNYYFDKTNKLHPFTHTTPANPNSLPPENALRIEPKTRKGYGPCESNGKWKNIQDHRGLEGYVDGKLFTITELGPLPQDGSETPPPPTIEELTQQIRDERNGLIQATDYLLMNDYPISEENLETLKTYRQALRDITEQSCFPLVIWPPKPAFLV